MNELKTSELLAKLIENAKLVGNNKNLPFTAEKFVVAIIDMLSSEQEEKTWELQEVELIIKKSIDDIAVAKEKLLEYISRPNGAFFLDDLYMKKKISQAMAIASATQKESVDCVNLLLCIINDPDAAIKNVMSAEAVKDVIEKEEETQQQAKNDFDKFLQKGVEQASETSEPEQKEEKKLEPEKSSKADIAALVKDVKRIRNELQAKIHGQDNAINVFVTGYFQAIMLSMLDKSRRRPRATFLFAGPPGVGKTFLAESSGDILGLPTKRFDMSEYSNHEAAIEFCGSDAVYKNNKQGNFTSYIKKHPKCLVILDEIEKAHISIIHLFLQVLDAGFLRDSNTDEEISFKDVILIFTTNAGKQLYQDSDSDDLSTISRKVIIDALQKDVKPETHEPYFPAAICSRFASGNVVMFNHIGAHNLRRIAAKEINRHVASLKNEMDINMTLDELVYTALLFSEGSKADARTIRSRAETFFNDELYELLRLVASDKSKTSIENIENIEVKVDLNNLPSDIKDFFTMEERKQILVLASEETVSKCAAENALCDVIGVQSSERAVEVIKSQNVDLILLDVKFGLEGKSADILNIEDTVTPARELLQTLHVQKNDIPVYLLECDNNGLDDEEKISFARQGISGFLKLAEKNSAEFAAEISEILSNLHQRASMIKLAKANKIISFETSQSISNDGKSATIMLFDFKSTVAVAAEDSKNVLSAVSKPNIRFDDVIGAKEAKKELAYFVNYLKNPKKYMGTGVKPPKGMLLYGPPGTGKTMLAKALACEADVTYIAAEGNDFLKSYVGEGSEKVHELFKTARKYAPSVLFVDEIDAIAKERRGGINDGGVEQTLTAFLTEMDGFANDPTKPVFVLAATNFDVEPGSAKSLDQALMRRFDRRIYIDLPDKDDRIRFLKKKISENKALDISDSQVENIAVRATGMSLAALDSAVELALRSAIREGSTKVTDAILEEAFETFNGGEVKKWDASQQMRVARHEAGHAFLCWLGGETPSYLTIVARGNHGGYMQHAEQEGKAIYTKDELLARIRTSLGGRAAEIAYYGEKDGISTGASGDLASATAVAQQIVCVYGMDEKFGLATVNGDTASNGTMSVEVRESVNRILNEQMNEAVRLISENKNKIDALVETLIDKNQLNSEEIKQVLEGAK